MLHPAFEITTVGFVLAYLAVTILSTTTEYQARDDLFDSLEKIFVSLFGFEVAVKLSALGWVEYFCDGWNLFDFSVITISVSMYVLQEASAVGLRSISLLRVARLVRVFTRTMYLMSHIRMLRVLLSTFTKLVAILTSVIGFLLIVVYIMMVLGMESMGSSSFDCSAEEPWCASFEDAQHAFLTCFQLLVGESWGDIMYRGMTAGGEFYYWIFFFAFYFILNMLVLNILAAMVLEVFTIEMDRSQEEEKARRGG